MRRRRALAGDAVACRRLTRGGTQLIYEDGKLSNSHGPALIEPWMQPLWYLKAHYCGQGYGEPLKFTKFKARQKKK